MHKKTLLGTVAVAATTLVLTATPAYAQTASVDITGARLLAKGAAVEVSVVYTCDVGYEGELSVQVLQTGRRREVNHGGGATLVECRGNPEVATVLASAGSAYNRGDAVIQGSLIVCNEFECISSPLVQEVFRIR